MRSPRIQTPVVESPLRSARWQHFVAQSRDTIHILNVYPRISRSQRHGVSTIRPRRQSEHKDLLELGVRQPRSTLGLKKKKDLHRELSLRYLATSRDRRRLSCDMKQRVSVAVLGLAVSTQSRNSGCPTRRGLDKHISNPRPRGVD
jgi:hypothetical protein